jgi:tRNA-specific 2-thiouridylase
VGAARGGDKNKDQSYFLTLLSQEQLRTPVSPSDTCSSPSCVPGPGGGAADRGQEGQPGHLLHRRSEDGRTSCGRTCRTAPGPIVRATDGRELGTHRGLHFYTLGQRRGIGMPSNTDHRNYVVVGKRATDNALLVAFDGTDAPGLFVQEVRVHRLQWNCPPVRQPRALEGRVRYRDPRVPLEFLPDEGDTATIRFQTPQRALASGQILALYDGSRLLGGGVYL